MVTKIKRYSGTKKCPKCKKSFNYSGTPKRPKICGFCELDEEFKESNLIL